MVIVLPKGFSAMECRTRRTVTDKLWERVRPHLPVREVFSQDGDCLDRFGLIVDQR